MRPVISACSKPTALLSASSERKEFEQTVCRKIVGFVRFCAAHAAHFMQDYRHACIRRLPRSFRSGEPAADDMNGFYTHRVRIILRHGKCKLRREPMKDPMRFHSLWTRAVGTGEADAIWRTLDTHYAEPVRAYHNWTHIEAMLAGLDGVRGEPELQGGAFR